MTVPYTPPSSTLDAFNCPLCHAFAQQKWSKVSLQGEIPGHIKGLGYITMTTCSHCDKETIWVKNQVVYPLTGLTPPPNQDMPEDLREDYDEAASILPLSSRGAAALLRLCIQKLCKHLGEKGKAINEDIGSLVQKGHLHPSVVKSLDIVRVTGNDAVHPGEINVKDDPETAYRLFGLVNFIVNETISRPKEIEAMFDSLPPNKLKEIESRNKRATQ